MSTTNATKIDPEASRVLDYWFPDPGPQEKWFQGGPTVDEEIRTQFEPLVQRARTSAFNPTWTATPSGTLALVILLDQFPRNLYRGSGQSFSSDELARSVAVNAIANGQDREIALLQRTFLYVTLMHHEDMTSQIAGLAFYELLLHECGADEDMKKFAEAGIDMARRHMKCIMKFGRFPARNKALGRESTEEEKAFLKENPVGF
jgi:uncharacterized protein (DUF924 family)